MQIQAEMNAAQKILRLWAVPTEVEVTVKEAEASCGPVAKLLKTLGVKLTDIRYGIEEAQGRRSTGCAGLRAVENIARQTGEKVAGLSCCII